jgi:glycosyltransferase involved in cell wall biosynthesis
MQPALVIIARDEERHIAGCLASVRGLSSEILLLLDSRTHDRTATLAAAGGAQVLVEPWRGFPAQRNYAMDCCQSPWVLFIDADERITPELAAEIRALPEDGPIVGYRLPRHNLFFGQALRGGGWYPDYQLRLLRRSAARYDELRLVHEYAELDGPSAPLSGHLTHHNIETLAELWAKQSRYALAEARTLALTGRRMRWRNLLGAPAREFWRRYLLLGGWRDGALGFMLCATMAWHEVVKFLFLASLTARDVPLERG